MVNVRILVSVSTGHGGLNPFLFSQPFERKIICLLWTFHLAGSKEAINLLFLACSLPFACTEFSNVLVPGWFLLQSVFCFSCVFSGDFMMDFRDGAC